MEIKKWQTTQMNTQGKLIFSWQKQDQSLQSVNLQTMQMQIVVAHGERRATREFELIWWPNIFSSNNSGKLSLRFYISKVTL